LTPDDRVASVRDAPFAAAQMSATVVVVVAMEERLREHEVVPVDGLLARPRQHLADV
jgi:hypothetical protein